MLEEIIRSVFTTIPVVIALSLLKREMSKKVEPQLDGSFELRVSRIYFFTGLFCSLLFLMAFFWMLLSPELPGEDRIFSLFALFFSLLGVYLIVLYRNYRLYFDHDMIVVTNLFGKKKSLKWSEIEQVKSNPFTGYLTLCSAQYRIKVLQNLKGFTAFTNALEMHAKQKS
jgi:hypothetical protein